MLGPLSVTTSLIHALYMRRVRAEQAGQAGPIFTTNTQPGCSCTVSPTPPKPTGQLQQLVLVAPGQIVIRCVVPLNEEPSEGLRLLHPKAMRRSFVHGHGVVGEQREVIVAERTAGVMSQLTHGHWLERLAGSLAPDQVASTCKPMISSLQREST